MNLKRLILITALCCLCSGLFAQPYGDNATNGSSRREQVIAQMNYCINSLTNIINHKSMPLLEHEIDQLLNNLTMEQIVGLYEIQSFRAELLDKISALQLTEEEKSLMKRVQALQRENLLYKSISNSLSSTMLLTGGGHTKEQMAFMAIVTIARTAVEYKASANEADIEELQAMWQFRKSDLENFAELRKSALELVYQLYQKYKLNEQDRLTESTASLFSQIISDPNPQSRIRRLHDHSATFSFMADYYYYLGMGYIDAEDYGTGLQYLNKYIEMYNRAPIFRYDEKTGCVALTRLALDNDLTKWDRKNLARIALANLPNNGPALIQVVLALNEIGEKEDAFNVLRSGIDNHLISDKDALIMLATRLLPEIKKYPLICTQIYEAVKNCQGQNLNSILSFLAEYDLNLFWATLPNLINLSPNGSISINAQYPVDIKSLLYIKETHKKESIKKTSRSLNYANAINIRKINRKFKTIKSNPETVYIFFSPLNDEGEYTVKANLDYKKITEGEYPGMKSVYFGEKERKAIAKFCEKKYTGNNGLLNIKVTKAKKEKKNIVSKAFCDYLFYPNEIMAIDTHSYDSDKTDVKQCVIQTNYEGCDPCFPFINQPTDIVRLKICGQDTLTVCFSGKKVFDLYSIERSGTINFYQPIPTSSTEITVQNDNEKSSWFKRLFKKPVKDTITSDNTSLEPNEMADTIIEVQQDSISSSKVKRWWKSIFKRKKEKDVNND